MIDRRVRKRRRKSKTPKMLGRHWVRFIFHFSELMKLPTNSLDLDWGTELQRIKKEQDAREVLEQERLKKLARAEKLKASNSRNLEELSEIVTVYSSILSSLKELNGKRRADEEWQRYTACPTLPDTRDLKALNTFLTTWDPVASLRPDSTVDFFQQCTNLSQSLAELKRNEIEGYEYDSVQELLTSRELKDSFGRTLLDNLDKFSAFVLRV